MAYCGGRARSHGSGSAFRPVRRHFRPDPSAATGTGADGSGPEAVRPQAGAALAYSPAAGPWAITVTRAESYAPSVRSGTV
jgi:hypothetical protein